MRSKHGNRKIKYNGVVLDSVLEADRYYELLLLEKAGKIWGLEVHPEFTIYKGFTDTNGKKHRAIKVEYDFKYIETMPGELVVEDTKGHKTAMFKLKYKMWLHQYGTLYNFRLLFRKDVGKYFSTGVAHADED